MPKFCFNCGAALADRAAFCSTCGTPVESGPSVGPLKPSSGPRYSIVGEPIDPTQDESAVRIEHPPNRKGNGFYEIGHAVRKHPFISVFVILIVCFLVSYTPSPSSGPAQQVDSYIPPPQKSFTSMIDSFIPRYKSADTEIRKTNVRFERKNGIIQYFSGSGGLRFQGWVGELQDLRTERDGEASFPLNSRAAKLPS